VPFADDTSLSYSRKNFDLMQIEINNDLQILDQWAKTWLVAFTPKKTKVHYLQTQIAFYNF
jgi:hypothetical protein